MSDTTGIEWTDATWNPVTGCSKVSAGCKHCYAERDWARLSANSATRYYGRKFTDVQCHNDVLELPLRWTKPRRIFVNSMSDLFHPDVPFEFIDKVFAVMALARRHTFQVLTKRPERMHVYLTARRRVDQINRAIWSQLGSRVGSKIEHGGEWRCALPLPNVWLGVSVEDQAAADDRIPQLLQTPAAVRFLSVEPMLGPIRLDLHGHRVGAPGSAVVGVIDWVICGGESGPKARPMHPDWVRGLRDQCAATFLPFLFKQWGEWLPTNSVDWCRSATAPENAMFREKYGRGVYEFPWKEGRAILRDGRTCIIYPKGDSRDIWSRPRSRLCDASALKAFNDYVNTGKNDPGYQWMYACGKKVAGRLLDGVQHDGYPEAIYA